MSITPLEQVNVLQLTLHNQLVGYLAGFQHGRNVLSFADTFRHNPKRPTFSLTTHPAFPQSTRVMEQPWSRHQRLHPVLSNLLPEGALREFIAQGQKVHADDEFRLLSCLGDDLPGAIVATPLAPDAIPESILQAYGNVKAIAFEQTARSNKFSLAGVQMKFSMKQKEGRYNLSGNGELGDWIIKTPSTRHPFVPLNEFTAMSLAAIAGIEIPDIQLTELDKLDNLPPINLPAERYAFAIRRFDRQHNARIHMEDFAQVLVKYPHEKYRSANYEQIGKVIYDFSGDGLADAQQFARRLLVNILLANGDAHLKNWSLLYADKVTPRLSPAYDIVTTRVYIEDETGFALKLAKTNAWYAITLAHFEAWSNKAGIPWRAVKPHLLDVIDKARTLWPQALKHLPMMENHKQQLVQHWASLQPDFRIIP